MKCCDRIIPIQVIFVIICILSIDCGLTKTQRSYLKAEASPITESYQSINTRNSDDKLAYKQRTDNFEYNVQTKLNDVWRETRSENSVGKFYYGDNGDPVAPATVSPKPIDLEACILGISDLYLWWLNEDYTIKISSKTFNKSMSLTDFSYGFILEMEFYKELERSSNKTIEFVSFANNNLARVPYMHLLELNETLQHLSLSGNKFIAQNFDYWASFPLMENLLELDLRECKISHLRNDTFVNLPNLEKLFLTYNMLESISAKAFNNLKNLQHLDFSYNVQLHNVGKDQLNYYMSGMEIDERVFKNLRNLTFLDLSHTKITQRSVKSLCTLNDKMEQLSLCYTGIPLLLNGMFLNSNLKVLDLSGNRNLVNEMHDESLAGLKNSLEILVFKNSSLKILSYFACLANLLMLDLSNNNIKEIVEADFAQMKDLQILDLRMNHISAWFSKVLSENSNLRIVNLKNNNINYITSWMLEDFKTVKFLAIGDNKFVCDCSLRKFFDVSAENARDFYCNKYLNMTVGQPYVLRASSSETSASQEEYEINFNDFIYKVLWRQYINYIKFVPESTQNIHQSSLESKSAFRIFPLTFPSVDCENATHSDGNYSFVLMDYTKASYRCQEQSYNQTSYFNQQKYCEKFGPEYENQTSSHVPFETTTHKDTDILQPEPEIQIRDDPDVEKIVAIVLLTVAVAVILLFWKRRQIRYFFILFKNSLILSLFDDDNNDKSSLIKRAKRKIFNKSDFIYDVFVSYSDKDRQWILEEFLPHIEKRSEINVCLHERDFQVGLSILENIISCMDQSRCLMLVISDAFLLSHWCQFEMHLAQHRLLETRREQLILILLEDIPRTSRPKTLHYLMKTKTYIVWPKEEKDRKTFWKRLKKAIIINDWEPDNVSSKGKQISYPKTPRHSII